MSPINRVMSLKRFEAEHREEAYKYFITSLKHYSSFAPAFTSLGIYYSEAATPPDPIRASKCFQKAFELDAREGDAARRLAEGFAEEREWDIVDVVANRAIEGEGGFEDSQEVIAGRYLPVNAWAWKASGVVHLVIFSSLLKQPSGLTARAEQR
jgi:superkiller protein 3